MATDAKEKAAVVKGAKAATEAKEKAAVVKELVA